MYVNGGEIREVLRSLLTSDSHSPTHTNGVYRAVGIIGEEHEAAGILVMLGVFLYSIKSSAFHPMFQFLCLILVWISLLFTYSAANIIVGLAFMLIVTVYKIRSFSVRSLSTVIVSLVILYSSLYTLLEIDEYVNPLLIRLSNAESWDVILSQRLEIEIFSELLAFFLGHAKGFELSEFGLISEVGLVRILYNTGMFLALPMLVIWIYPILLYINTDKAERHRIYPYVVTIYSGLATLVHYGVLFRSTNIVLFFSMYGILVNLYLSLKFKSNPVSNA